MSSSSGASTFNQSVMRPFDSFNSNAGPSIMNASNPNTATTTPQQDNSSGNFLIFENAAMMAANQLFGKPNAQSANYLNANNNNTNNNNNNNNGKLANNLINSNNSLNQFDANSSFGGLFGMDANKLLLNNNNNNTSYFNTPGNNNNSNSLTSSLVGSMMNANNANFIGNHRNNHPNNGKKKYQN
jgi:hypothetical protein